jgi:hypothetical protein
VARVRISCHLIALLLAGALAAGCATHAQATAAVEPPPLNPPEPPARFVLPLTEEPTLPPVIDEPPATSSPVSGTARTPPRNPNPRPATPPPVVETPPAPPPPTPAVLSTNINTAEFEQRIQRQLDRARADLKLVKREQLGTDAQAHFDAAQGFIRQAEGALKVKNLIYAGQLADKAATMAALLKKG